MHSSEPSEISVQNSQSVNTKKINDDLEVDAAPLPTLGMPINNLHSGKDERTESPGHEDVDAAPLPTREAEARPATDQESDAAKSKSPCFQFRSQNSLFHWNSQLNLRNPKTRNSLTLTHFLAVI